MRLYERQTQKLTFQNLPHHLQEAFSKLQERKQKEDIDVEVEKDAEVYLTTSVEIKKGFLIKLFGGKIKSVQVAVLLLNNFLLLIISSDEKTANTLLYPYKDIDVKKYVPPQIKMMPPIEDFGLEILGYRLGGTERDSYFLGLGENKDGQELIELLQAKAKV